MLISYWDRSLCPEYLDKDQQTEAIPTGLHCKLQAEVEESGLAMQNPLTYKISCISWCSAN